MLLLRIIAIFNFYNRYLQNIEDSKDYGVMVDAGSSGTRIYVYEWENSIEDYEVDKEATLSTIKPSEYKTKNQRYKQVTMKKNGGISSIFDSNNQKTSYKIIDDYLKDLINYAKRYVPTNKHNNTYIFFKATAGMRLMDINDSNALLNIIKEILNSSGFRFDLEYGAEIIPGEYEGIFSWIAINHIFDTMNESDQIPRVNENNFATLDLGGASTQITFQPEIPPFENSFPLNLSPNYNKILFTHSYLQYGRNQARIRYHELKLNNINKSFNQSDIIYEPCYVKGYKEDFIANNPDLKLNLIGSGDFSECLKKVKRIVIQENNDDEYGINGIYQPKIPMEMKIVAINGFYRVANFFNCLNSSEFSNLNCILESAQRICSTKNYEKYAKEHYSKYDEKDFNYYCFNAAYILNLMNTGYKIDNDREIMFVKQAKGLKISWTLGAMIWEVSQLIN